jgi:hypothetical protein
VPKLDDRVWKPDLLSVLDWQHVYDGTQQAYADDPLATWWVQATAGVNYYRAELPARHLPGKWVRLETWDLETIPSDGEPAFHFPRQAGDTAIWLFPGNDTKAILMAEMKLQGTKVFVEVDDNYMIPPAMPGLSEWRTTRDSKTDEANYETHRKIVERVADGVIVSTERLAEVYSALHDNIHVCRNSFDPADWDPDPPHQKDGVLRVGWAGSASHGYDVSDIRSALDWASRQPDVDVVILGQLGFEGIRYRQVPWTNSLAQYRKNICELDVILCPLRENQWSACKSDVKAVEGALAGAVPVVSRTEPYAPWWRDGGPCLVADSPKGFVRAVKELVSDREGTAKLAADAREYVLSERNIANEVETWRSALA